MTYVGKVGELILLRIPVTIFRSVPVQPFAIILHRLCPDITLFKNKKFWEELIRLLSLHTSLYVMAAIVTLAKDCM
jgi:hypothetical protein